MTPACMGGWCAHRDHCARYHAEDRTSVEPSERLCARGQEAPEPMFAEPVQAERACIVADKRFAAWLARV